MSEAPEPESVIVLSVDDTPTLLFKGRITAQAYIETQKSRYGSQSAYRLTKVRWWSDGPELPRFANSRTRRTD